MLNLFIVAKSTIIRFSVFFFFLLITISVYSANSINERFYMISAQIEVNAFSHTQIAKQWLAELQAISSKHPDNISFTIQTLYKESYINFYQLINDSILLAKCALIANTWNAEKYPFENALLNYALAMCYSADGNFANAFSLALKSLEQFQTLKNHTYTGKVYYLLGNICLATQSRKEAMEYYQHALDIAPHGQRDYYLPFIAYYSNLIYSEEEKQTGMDSLKSFITYYENSTDMGLLVAAAFNLGSIYYMAGNEQEGAQYYDLCKSYVETYNIDNNTLQFGLFYNFGKLYFNRGEYEKALAYSYLAKEIADKNNGLTPRSLILSQIADIYDKMNNLDSAYYYLLAYNEVRNQIVNNSRTIDSYKAYISVYLESLEKGLIIASNQKKQFIIITIFIAIILLLALGLLAVLQQRRLTMAQQIKQDKQIQELQEDKIESQQRELSSQILLLLRKNELLQQMNQHVNALPQNNADVLAIKQIVKENLTVEHVWNDFVIHFNSVHPNFFDKLKTRAPYLTENNLRFCAYLRISMTAKQIAQVLNMSPENVRKSSYRLKKKLLLGEDANLYDFLRTI